VWTAVFANAEVATKEARANMVMWVFIELSFVSDVRLSVVIFAR